MIKAALILVALETGLIGVVWLAGQRSRSSIALALLCLTAPLEVYRADIGPGNLSLFRLSLIAAVVVVVVEHRSRVLGLARNPLVLLLLGLVAFMAISLVVLSDNEALARIVLAQAAASVVAAIAFCALAAAHDLAHITRLLVAGAVLPVLAAVAESFLGSDGRFSLPLLSHLPIPAGLEVTRQDISLVGTGQRLRGTFGDPNHFGAYMALTSMLALGMFARAGLACDRRSATVYAAMALAAVAMLGASLSRSAWLGATAALVAVLVIVMAHRGLRPRVLRRWRPALACGLAGLAAMAPLAPSIVDRLDSGRTENRASTDTHEETAREALGIFRSEPLLGIGVADLGPRLGEGPRTSGAHSSYLTIAAELGAVGLLILIACIALLLRVLWLAHRITRAPPETALTAAMLAAYAGLLSSNAFYDLWWDDFHWTLVGCILVLSLRADGLLTPITAWVTGLNRTLAESYSRSRE